ncbi:hypothetical protein B0H63DRAFT_521431 [Podospora didyma]|uniref:Uncharacterized protein n=1 Tax=Podospora didyma TaxID=330526 RepID=A0AAE0NTW6_9PEZI|nr:hypothetical protein B0H63DRAFT_521431 [Podospora didyma]
MTGDLHRLLLLLLPLVGAVAGVKPGDDTLATVRRDAKDISSDAGVATFKRQTDSPPEYIYTVFDNVAAQGNIANGDVVQTFSLTGSVVILKPGYSSLDTIPTNGPNFLDVAFRLGTPGSPGYLLYATNEVLYDLPGFGGGQAPYTDYAFVMGSVTTDPDQLTATVAVDPGQQSNNVNAGFVAKKILSAPCPAPCLISLLCPPPPLPTTTIVGYNITSGGFSLTITNPGDQASNLSASIGIRGIAQSGNLAQPYAGYGVTLSGTATYSRTFTFV